MTKANDRARARAKDAEKRARQKLARLEKKGVNTGSISPIRKVDQTNTRALNSYIKTLENFIDRKTRYVAGFGGQPIEYSLYQEFRKSQKSVAKKRESMFAEYKDEVMRAKAAKVGMTLEEYVIYSGELKASPFRRKKEYVGIEHFTRQDVEDYIQSTKHKLTKKYDQELAQRLRKNMYGVSEYLNSTRVRNALRGMSNRQLFLLHELTDFTSVYYSMVSSDPDEVDEVADAIDSANAEEHAMYLIQTIKQDYPNKSKKSGKKKRKR